MEKEKTLFISKNVFIELDRPSDEDVIEFLKRGKIKEKKNKEKASDGRRIGIIPLSLPE